MSRTRDGKRPSSMAFGSWPSTWGVFCGTQMANSGEEGTILSPSAFYAAFSKWSHWVSGWFLHTAPQLLHTQIGKDSTPSWALDISLKNNFCTFGLEARSPETLILALTMTWVTSAGKAFWDRPLEGLWCFVGCLNKRHNPDKCTVSEPRMGFGTGSTLNGDVA